MKRLIGLMVLGVLLSCAEEETAPTKTYTGNFLMYDGSAIIEVNEVMYTITTDDMAKELAAKTKESQNSEFDMVPVTIEAVVKPKPADTEGWDSILTIKKIIEVQATAVSPDIELEETQQ